ncbi:hypothetical protein PHISCL_03821 [Aspergillus sclerotialis]|uniref:Secreted protein n=1 Tax=Aspergillus sclerotialis TaxID=2070753 RepID=A0A3A2ZKV7_9EURO|nr:hypothetical protein PHISCL_03821 [Aspergillus sclerotialis]
MVSGKLITILAAAFTVVGAIEAPLPGYEVEDLTWEVEHTEGQPAAHLNGTIQQIHDQILELNPDFKLQQFSPVEKREESDLLAKLATRDCVVCSNFPGTQRSRVYQGIDYLRGIKGKPWLGPGPGKCIRVSCAYNAAIWWCNDEVSATVPCVINTMLIHFHLQNKEIKILPSFTNIAQGASLICQQCTTTGKSAFEQDQPWVHVVSGQDFHQDNWNVIVRWNEC